MLAALACSPFFLPPSWGFIGGFKGCSAAMPRGDRSIGSRSCFDLRRVGLGENLEETCYAFDGHGSENRSRSS